MEHLLADIKPTEAIALRQVLDAVRRVAHGYVTVIVQDSRVVQIDTTEKVRVTGTSELHALPADQTTGGPIRNGRKGL
jgi:hypothetical protein